MRNYWTLLIFSLPGVLFLAGCGTSPTEKVADQAAPIRLITLDPGHFHAALVQKTSYKEIDTVVHVYAPGGPELESHLALVDQYNTRAENPTHWAEKVYTGSDFVEKMLADKSGNLVILAGNNRYKTQYIKKAVDAGLHVLGDKPMAITMADFDVLQNAFAEAAKKNVLLYDIMTERSEITNLLQKELMGMPELFGELLPGSAKDPAVTIESVHFFYKYVSGKVLTRPDWFFDPTQQGDAMVDVGTHLIDLVQWECFSATAIDYKKDISLLGARTWPTPITLSQFAAITKRDSFPAFLHPYVEKDTILQTHANGEMQYLLKGIHVKMTARWEFKAPEGSGDTHYSLMKGTKASLEIKQGREENFQPTLFIIPIARNQQSANAIQKAIDQLQAGYPGITVERSGDAWKINIPAAFKVGHEAHFGQVMERYLSYIRDGRLPAWEVPCMLAKYYTAIKGLDMARSKK